MKLYSAVSKKTVRFNQLHEKDHRRIQMQRWCPEEEAEVPYEEIVKGYDQPDKYVVITPGGEPRASTPRRRGRSTSRFVDLDEIDSITSTLLPGSRHRCREAIQAFAERFRNRTSTRRDPLEGIPDCDPAGGRRSHDDALRG